MCVELTKAHMTFREADRNLNEMIDTSKNDDESQHYIDVSIELAFKELDHLINGGSVDDIVPSTKI
jgi:hypothetical protein